MTGEVRGSTPRFGHEYTCPIRDSLSRSPTLGLKRIAMITQKIPGPSPLAQTFGKIMTADELEALRIRIGVPSQEAMAVLLQCDPVGYRRYASGARPVPRYIERSARILEFVHQKKLLAQLEAWLE